MIEILSAVLVIVTLGAIIGMMFRTRRPSADVAVRHRGGALPHGLLAAVALGLAVEGVAPGWSPGLITGAIVALLYAMLGAAADSSSLPIAVLSAVLGAVGLIATVGGYVSLVGQCTPTELWLRFAVILVVAGAMAVGILLSWVRSLLARPAAGSAVLAAFGALEIVEFLASPLGASLVDIGALGWVVGLTTAVAIGFAVSIWPELVIIVAGVAVVVAGLAGSIAGNATCLAGPEFSGLAPVIGFLAVYLVVGRALSWLLGR